EAPAVAASLDTPRAVAISPAGLVTLADSGNQRVRQIDALPSPGPDIHTIAGLGMTAPGTLSLNGPSVSAYGSGTVTATLSSTTLATGTVTFLDTSGGTVATLGAVGLSGGSASFSTAALGAGTHSVVAVYVGDARHGAAQSPSLAITVTPLAAIAVANPASILYGQAIPALGGTLGGVLAQDAGKVGVVFTTSAAALSPVGLYPIAAALTGSAAGDYTVSVVPPTSLSIAKAPSIATLSASVSNQSAGLPITLTMGAASTTSGVPTGSITLRDGATVLAVVPLSAIGGASFSTSAMASGTHGLTSVYSGDANFLPATSLVTNVVVDGASDFALTATGATSQSIPAGTSATFNFSVAMTGAALASPITLAAQGVPTGATASLNPTYLPPGGGVTSFTLTILTPRAGLDKRARPGMPDAGATVWLAVLLLPTIGFARSRLRGRDHGSRLRLAVTGGFCILFGSLVTGCGDRINSAAESSKAVTYTLTVTGTATGPAGIALQHSANVTLEVL
ncbi:MAG TPA: Ig-like domain repeat protein, partial [Acidobacteriaceae bacterium]